MEPGPDSRRVSVARWGSADGAAPHLAGLGPVARVDGVHHRAFVLNGDASYLPLPLNVEARLGGEGHQHTKQGTTFGEVDILNMVHESTKEVIGSGGTGGVVIAYEWVGRTIANISQLILPTLPPRPAARIVLSTSRTPSTNFRLDVIINVQSCRLSHGICSYGI